MRGLIGIDRKDAMKKLRQLEDSRNQILKAMNGLGDGKIRESLFRRSLPLFEELSGQVYQLCPGPFERKISAVLNRKALRLLRPVKNLVETGEDDLDIPLTQQEAQNVTSQALCALELGRLENEHVLRAMGGVDHLVGEISEVRRTLDLLRNNFEEDVSKIDLEELKTKDGKQGQVRKFINIATVGAVAFAMASVPLLIGGIASITNGILAAASLAKFYSGLAMTVFGVSVALYSILKKNAIIKHYVPRADDLSHTIESAKKSLDEFNQNLSDACDSLSS